MQVKSIELVYFIVQVNLIGVYVGKYFRKHNHNTYTYIQPITIFLLIKK